MMGYRNRKIISGIIFVPIVLIVLLSINFSIWGGYYEKGCLEDSVHQQMALIQEGTTKSVIFADQKKIDFHPMFYGFLLCLAITCPVFLIHCIYIHRKQGISKPVTLRSLDVRLND
jgi:hypothetical protein